MPIFDQWPLWALAGAMLAAAAVIAFAGTRLTQDADRLSSRTLGQALFGAIFLGAVTSLSGVITSISTAWQGFAELSVSNAIGGIAAQTAFLAIADLLYRRANLEHASASAANLFASGLLILMLAVALAANAVPAVTVFAVHPVSILLVVVYIYFTRMARRVSRAPLWQPEETHATAREKSPEDAESIRLTALWTRFWLLALVVGVAGFAVGELGIALVESLGWSEALVGVLLTSIATSLPELVTSIAAVRRNAVNLAVGGIIGGNSFDVLFLSFSDVAYRDGSLYHAMAGSQLFLVAVSIVMAAILLLGLLRREPQGFAGIGFESTLVLVIYAGTIVALSVL